MMNIGIVDVDGHHFPNFALMRASAYHKVRGDQVEWATPFSQYDKIMASKVFTFTPDFNYLTLQADISQMYLSMNQLVTFYVLQPMICCNGARRIDMSSD